MDYNKQPNAIINQLIKNKIFGFENWKNENALIKWSFTNWADMGPIIQKNDMGVFLSGVDSARWTAMSDNGDYDHNDNDPLRAAAICYLMNDRL